MEENWALGKGCYPGPTGIDDEDEDDFELMVFILLVDGQLVNFQMKVSLYRSIGLVIACPTWGSNYPPPRWDGSMVTWFNGKPGEFIEWASARVPPTPPIGENRPSNGLWEPVFCKGRRCAGKSVCLHLPRLQRECGQ